MTLSVGMRVNGLKEARATVANMAAGAKEWQRTRIGIGSAVPYAHWIERGFYWGGRPGQTTAVRYMERAVEQKLPEIGARIAAAFQGGAAAVSAEADKISAEIAEKAQQLVTVRSGTLRDSIKPNRGQGLRRIG